MRRMLLLRFAACDEADQGAMPRGEKPIMRRMLQLRFAACDKADQATMLRGEKAGAQCCEWKSPAVLLSSKKRPAFSCAKRESG
ncbi:MAG: hypothetical protein HPZ91_20630 [Lentisphaeria bacterium]|nr:hypothetical protein [Lentisphaeria bacterium]